MAGEFLLTLKRHSFPVEEFPLYDKTTYKATLGPIKYSFLVEELLLTLKRILHLTLKRPSFLAGGFAIYAKTPYKLTLGPIQYPFLVEASLSGVGIRIPTVSLGPIQYPFLVADSPLQLLVGEFLLTIKRILILTIKRPTR